MFSGALLLLTDLLCVYLRPFFGGPFRETSFTTGKRRAHPGTFGIKPQKAGISLIPPASTRRRKTSHRISKIPSTQQDSLESARFPRTSKITSNQQDSFELDRLSLSGSLLPNPADIRPRLHAIETHLPTAIHSQRLSHVESSVIEGHIGLSRVCGESVVGLRPLLIDCI